MAMATMRAGMEFFPHLKQKLTSLEINDLSDDEYSQLLNSRTFPKFRKLLDDNLLKKMECREIINKILFSDQGEVAKARLRV